jgi:nucleoside-diphosphate-sugar epimerase
MTRTALIAGSTGISGRNLAERLVANGWQVHGLARHPVDIPGVRPVAADLLQREALAQALAEVRPTHLFICTWLRQPTEAENVRVNGAMVRNLFDALGAADRAPHASLQHAALVTGMKHYLGPFEAYGKGEPPATPFEEDQPRLPVANFYYTQEDELFAAAGRAGFGWSVHRASTIIGHAIGNAMNMGATLAVYATICRETGRPFVFPGVPAQWHSLSDVTDARLLAAQLEWAATAPAARNQAFNTVNGDLLRWKNLWPQVAAAFGLQPAPFPGHATPLEQQMADDASLWEAIAHRHGLAEPRMDRLASAWHTDADLGRPFECIASMTKSRKAGFLGYQDSLDSFLDLFARLRAERLIPS